MFDEEQLVKGCDQLGIVCTAEQRAALAAYTRELSLWNAKMNLVGGDLKDFTARHLLDSLASIPIIRTLPRETIADLGSGAGLPGIPLAIMMPESALTLIERSGKKAGFLRSCAASLGLANLRVLESAWEQASGMYRVLVCRAFADLSVIVKAAGRLCAEGGTVAAYKGKRSEAEGELVRAGLGAAESAVLPLRVPYLSEERTLTVIRLKTPGPE